MATEADTSGYDPIGSPGQPGLHRYSNHKHQQQQQQQQRHAHISSSGLQTTAESNFFLAMSKANSLAMDDDDNDDNDKLISVDDFDEMSENEEGSRSSLGFTSAASDSTVNSSSSPRCGNSNSNKLRKKGGLAAKCMDDKELQQLRLKINSRERKRMHDLNSALDGLREVMPYANGPSVRKLSKIATLLLAKNYILMLNSSLEEMKKLVSDVYHTHPTPRGAGHPGVIPQPHPTNPPTLHPTPQPPPPPAVPIQSPTPSSVGAGGHIPTSAGSGTILANSRREGSSSPVTPSSTSSEGSCHTLRGSPQAASLSEHGLSQASPQLPPLSVLPTTPLPAHSATTPHFLPLTVPAMRSQLPGLLPHDISALASSLAVPKSDIPPSHLPLHVFNTHDRLHALSRWPAPCACAQCLTGSNPLTFGLHLSRFANPLLASASLPRKG